MLVLVLVLCRAVSSPSSCASRYHVPREEGETGNELRDLIASCPVMSSSCVERIGRYLGASSGGYGTRIAVKD